MSSLDGTFAVIGNLFFTDNVLTSKEYMEAYTTVFKLLTTVPGQGEILYPKVCSFVVDAAKKMYVRINAADNEALIATYCATWSKYNRGNKCANGILSFLNRQWIDKQRIAVNGSNIVEVRLLFNDAWRTHVIEPLHLRLCDVILDTISRERRKELVVNAGQMSEVFTSFISSTRDANLGQYTNMFEQYFLASTATFFESESALYLSQHGVLPYMELAETRIAEELEHVRLRMPAKTADLLLKVLIDKLVCAHAPLLMSHFASMLRDDKIDDASRLYRLISRMPNGVAQLAPTFAEYVQWYGLRAVEEIIEKATPDVYIGALLRVSQYTRNIVREAFDNSPEMASAYSIGTRNYANKNAFVTKTQTNELSVTAVALATYTDMILKKGSHHIPDESLMNTTIAGVIDLFLHLTDKDVFLFNYQRKLARRLIQELSANDDFEKTVVLRLREVQGPEFTSKLSTMIGDMETSRDLNIAFSEEAKDLSHDFSMTVLASGRWPTGDSMQLMALPNDVSHAVDAFKKFYSRQHEGRVLKIVYGMSRATILSKCQANGRLRLTTSSFQMAVLLAFNNVDIASISYLLATTVMSEESLYIALVGLVKTSVLLVDKEDVTSWTPDTSFTVNLALKPLRAILSTNIPVTLANTRTSSPVAVDSTEVNREREFKLHAAMVRILKARRSIEHKDFFLETAAQVQKYFRPEVSMMKKAVEHLIDLEYCKRREGTKYYEYIA